MTENKRFEINNLVKKGNMSFWDNENKSILNASHTLDLLNNLLEENEQLKQFKDKTFDLFNKEITGNEKAIEWGEKQGVDIGAIGFHTNMLKILRKELEND